MPARMHPRPALATVKAPARASHGFSLLETLVVVVLIAAASMLALATLGGGIERMQVRSAAGEVAANLRFTRAHALATGQPQRFTLDPVARTWQAPRERAGRLPDGLDVVFTGAREVQARQDKGAIVFFDDGASTGGRVRLEGDRMAWQIDVAWLTGEVRIARVDR